LFSEATTTTLLPPTTETKTKTETAPSSSDSSTRKRLGKSSFLYKQQTANIKGDTTASTISSATDLRLLAEKHAGKTIGSSQHKKAWTRWLYVAIESIREDLGEHLLLQETSSENHDDEQEKEMREAFEKLFFDLGVAADEGTMPSFESGAARKGYALEFFCRGRALAEFFLETPLEAGDNSDEGVYPRFWTQSLRSPECPILAASASTHRKTVSLLSEEPKPTEASSTYEIVSLGGGPGFDFVGVALAAAFSFHSTTPISTATTLPSPNIHVTAMDYEEGWSDLVSAMDRSTRNLLNPLSLTTNDDDDSFAASNVPAMSCDWGGKCDITKSILHEPVNANCKRLLLGGNTREKASKLWICQYCVAENAKALRESDYVFLKELVQEMPKGTMVLLTEVVPRLWPEMVRMLHKESLLPLVDVGFRKGYRGKQFLLKKRETRRLEKGIASGLEHKHEDHDGPFESLDDRTRDQLEHFERLASYHDRKVDTGWKRQGRKDNGSAAYHEEQLRRRRNRPEEK
jgi:hypothetical protein